MVASELSDSAFVNHPGNFRRAILLAIFSTVQFLDVFGVYVTLISLPAIGEDLNIDSATQNWIVNGYLVAFASFLLFAGLLSDRFSPRIIFTIGLAVLGILSLVAPFCDNAIGLIVLKSFSGIGASVTIPSAIKLITQMYRDTESQAKALGIFCATGGLANVIGTIVGGCLTQADWRWCFWILTIIALPLSPISFFLTPKEKVLYHKGARIDVISVIQLVIAVVLLIFALTSGNNVGWGTAQVIAPLVISIITFIIFASWQTRVDQRSALLPKRLWTYPGFTVLFGICFMITPWWTTTLESLTKIYIDVWEFEPLSAVVHFIPFGISSVLCSISIAYLLRYINTKAALLFGFIASTTGAIVLGFGDDIDKFWRLQVPGMVIGSGGSAILYCASNVAMIQSAPNSESGLVGGVFVTAQQLGSAIGISLFTVVQLQVDKRDTSGNDFIGTSAGDWFLAGVHFCGLLLILFLLPWKVGAGENATVDHNEKEINEDEEGKKDTKEIA
ncbi:hypothetical protein E3Q24_03849 [Wallemia mellicola]|nr:hypothetical protein E3Q24_03849 [Wallemia mellicola]TIC20206.1 MFS general substrate transporter [Wallemia mellicola]